MDVIETIKRCPPEIFQKKNYPQERCLMGAVKLLKIEYPYVHEEILSCGYKETTGIDLIEGFLLNRGITSLDDVDIDTAIDYYNMVHKQLFLSDGQKSHFASALETVIRLRSEGFSELENCIPKGYVRNKLIFFLALNKIHSLSEIDATHRKAYERYLLSTGCTHATEYVRAIDTAKLYSIEQSMNDLRPHVLKYDNVHIKIKCQ